MNKILIFIFMIVAGISQSLAQCPMCKSAVESNLKDGESSVGLGLNDGILYLLAMPYILVGVVGYMWYKRHKARKAA